MPKRPHKNFIPLIENERENFRHLFKETPEMVCILKGKDHVFEFVNEAHIKVLGFDATGKSVREAQPESVEVHGILDEVYRSGVTAKLFEILVTVQDRRRYFNLTFAARRSLQGEIDGIMILGTEVTDQVLLRNSLRQSQDRLQLALESGQMRTWSLNLQENQGSFPEQLERGIHPEDVPQVSQSLQEAIDQRKPFSAEYRIQGPDGQIHWSLSRGSLAFDPQGKPLLISGISMDITERKVAATVISESRERYKVLFDFSPNPKWIFDIETLQILEVNQTAIRHYGYSREEFLSMRVTDLRPPEDRRRFVEAMRQKYSKETSFIHKNYRHLKKDGSIVHVEVSTIDITFNGHAARLAAVVDVTERVRALERQEELLNTLKVAKEEAERANELKSSFLANMSHEIRTPLGAMIGFADLLRDRDISDEDRSTFIDIMVRNGHQLSHLINDILDLSKVESGHLTIECVEVVPRELVQEVVSLLSVKAMEKGFPISLTVEDSVPTRILTDPLRLRQILTNVIGNAIKFTQKGQVGIRVFNSENETIAFEVKDTGIGISREDTNKLFRVFRQADDSVSRKFGGTGLGLVLSRRLAQALGGNVVLSDSVKNQGSTFLVTVSSSGPAQRPTRKPAIASRETPSSRNLSGLRVLLVEDASDNQDLIRRILSKRGMTVDIAPNGLEGMRKALAGSYDIVLMDIQMPVMDGYTATQKLRQQGYQKPIIAITAHAMPEERSRCLQSGCTDHLVKPIDREQLMMALERSVSQ